MAKKGRRVKRSKEEIESKLSRLAEMKKARQSTEFDNDPYDAVDHFHLDKDSVLGGLPGSKQPKEKEVFKLKGVLSDEEEFDYDDEGAVDEDMEGGGEGGSDQGESEEEVKMGSDLESEGGSEDSVDAMMASRSWGSSAAAYYGTDRVGHVKGRYERRLAAEEEEEAAIADKRVITDLITEHDFQADYLFDDQDEQDDSAAADEPKPTTEHSLLSVEEKVANLKKRCPELTNIIKDYNDIHSDFENRIKPLFLHTPEEDRETLTYQFIKLNYTVYLHYIMSLTIYFLLKFDGEPTDNHPVMEKLVTYRQHIDKLQRMGEKCHNFSAFQDSSSVPQEDTRHSDAALDLLDKLNQLRVLRSNKNSEKPAGESRVKKSFKRKQEEAPAVPEGEKRDISQPILRNKSVVDYERYRTTKFKNPRSKNRNKYAKGIIKRKSQVRPMRQETTRYEGEARGINKTAKRSVLLS